jgi:hypothetical protein
MVCWRDALDRDTKFLVVLVHIVADRSADRIALIGYDWRSDRRLSFAAYEELETALSPFESSWRFFDAFPLSWLWSLVARGDGPFGRFRTATRCSERG